MFFKTSRTDKWWIEPFLIILGLGLFGVYACWAALQGEHYEWGPYLSPFYASPLLPQWWKLSPALLVIWIPLGFRATCYYFRRAYYRAFFFDPPACAVGEPRERQYKGEGAFPFIFQNIHRYFMYLALVLLILHWIDLPHAFNFSGKFGVGLGTLILLVDAILLSLYVFSCHSVRHIVGGHRKCFSACGLQGKIQHQVWQEVSCLNTRHMLWAWLSLFTVGFADLYIRLLSMGLIQDVRIF